MSEVLCMNNRRIMMYRFNIVPVPKPRQTQRDKWLLRDPVARYRAFANDLRIQAREQDFVLPDSHFHCIFYLPMPKSWPKKKREQMLGAPHQSVPDTDNLLKGLIDALRPGNDAGVWDERGTKRWAIDGKIEILIEEEDA